MFLYDNIRAVLGHKLFVGLDRMSDYTGSTVFINSCIIHPCIHFFLQLCINMSV